MDEKDMPAFFKFLSVMEEYYQPLSPMLREIYWKGLKAFPLLSVKKALWQHIHTPKDGKFLPKIADFVRYLEGTQETKAMIAWSQVSKAIETIGAYHSVVFDNPIITEVIVHMGGWIKLCQSKTHELPFIAKEFEKLYGHYATRTRSFADSDTANSDSSAPNTNTDRKWVDSSEQACLSPLCGIFERENNVQGYDSPPPVVISSNKQSKTLSLPSNPKMLTEEVISEIEETKTGTKNETGAIHER